MASDWGETKFGMAHYSPDSRANVQSFAATRDAAYDVQYNSEQDRFEVQMENNGKVYLFVRHPKHDTYMHDTKNKDHTLSKRASSLPITVAERKSKYSKREIKAVDEARELMRKAGDISPADLCTLLRFGVSRMPIILLHLMFEELVTYMARQSNSQVSNLS